MNFNATRRRLLLHHEVLEGQFASFQSAPLTPDEKYLFSLAKATCYTISVSISTTYRQTQQFTSYAGTPQYNVGSSFPSPDSKLSESIFWNGIVRICWDIEPGLCKHVIGPYEAPMWAGAWAPDSSHLVFSNGQGIIYVCEIGLDGNDGNEAARYLGKKGWIRALQRSPDGKPIAMGTENESFMMWDPYTREVL